MKTAARIVLTADHRDLVLHILAAHLPPGSTAWVFGSRATGRARPHSDLDLAVDAGRRLTLDETARLSEAFSDSDLPWKVDIVDWHAIDERFREIIAAERTMLCRTAARRRRSLARRAGRCILGPM